MTATRIANQPHCHLFYEANANIFAVSGLFSSENEPSCQGTCLKQTTAIAAPKALGVYYRWLCSITSWSYISKKCVGLAAWDDRRAQG